MSEDVTHPATSVGGTSIGRIVHYTLSEDDARDINRRRHDYQRPTRGDVWPAGAQAHVGNRVVAGEIVPMLIVQVWTGDTVNGQAFLDGNDSLWVTSAEHGEGLGQWRWPARV